MSLISEGTRVSVRLFTKYNRNCVRFLNLINNRTAVRNFASNTRKNVKGVFKLGLAGVTVGALVGTGYSIHQLNKPRQHIINEELTIPIVQNLPKIQPSRKVVFKFYTLSLVYTKSGKQVRYLGDQSGLKLTLYQYQTCPFCCKVRAFLDYYGISYDLVEVDPVLRQSIKWSSYKKVPILVVSTNEGYQPFNDSSMIISAISSYIKDRKELREIVKYYPFISFIDEDGSKKTEIMNKYFLMLAGKSQQINTTEISEERKWRKWADDVLVHTLSPNVYRTRSEALQAFNWFSEVGEWEKNFPSWERNLIIYAGALAMWMIGRRLKKKYNLKDDVRESLYDDCNYWMKAVEAKGTKLMGGNDPNLADLAVFGVLSSIEGCDAFKDLLEHSKINNWYFSMKEAVSNHHGAKLV